MNVAKRIKLIRKKQGLTQQELAIKAKISRSYLADLERGRYNPSLDTLQKIAEALSASIDSLTGESASSIIESQAKKLGMDLPELAEKAKVPLKFLENLDDIVPDHEADGGEQCFTYINTIAWVLGIKSTKLKQAFARQAIPADAYETPNLSPEEAFKTFQDGFAKEDFREFIPIRLPKNTIRIPVLGSIPAGMAIEAVEDIIKWVDIPEEWTQGNRQYFGLLVKGDSMYPEYLEGDTVIIRQQPCFDSGDDCAVMINDTDATLKRVRTHEDGIELEAINPMYGKKKFTNEEVEQLPVRVLGVVVELRRKKK